MILPKLKISCFLKDGKPCKGNIYKKSSNCGKVPVSVQWRYCNLNKKYVFVPFKSSSESYIKSNGKNENGLNKAPLWKGKCRSVVTKEYIDTCEKIHTLKMKVRGTFRDSKNTFGSGNSSCKAIATKTIVTKSQVGMV